MCPVGFEPIASQARGMQTLVRIVVIALAVAVAAWLVPGIVVTGSSTANVALTLIAVAAIIAVVNSFVKPILATLTGCLIVLTLGLFLLVINALMLMLAAWIAGTIGLGFQVDGFWAALFGSIIISLVTMLLSGLIPDRRRTA